MEEFLCLFFRVLIKSLEYGGLPLVGLRMYSPEEPVEFIVREERAFIWKFVDVKNYRLKKRNLKGKMSFTGDDDGFGLSL